MVLPGWVSQLLVGCMVNACVESTQKGTLTDTQACLQHSPALVAATHQLLLCYTLLPWYSRVLAAGTPPGS